MVDPSASRLLTCVWCSFGCPEHQVFWQWYLGHEGVVCALGNEGQHYSVSDCLCDGAKIVMGWQQESECQAWWGKPVLILGHHLAQGWCGRSHYWCWSCWEQWDPPTALLGWYSKAGSEEYGWIAWPPQVLTGECLHWIQTRYSRQPTMACGHNGGWHPALKDRFWVICIQWLWEWWSIAFLKSYVSLHPQGSWCWCVWGMIYVVLGWGQCWRCGNPRELRGCKLGPQATWVCERLVSKHTSFRSPTPSKHGKLSPAKSAK